MDSKTETTQQQPATPAVASKDGLGTYTFGEAFMLMWYQCDCGHRERIWNSRDGITPFCTGCPSCGGDLRHVEWANDQRSTNHKLHYGQKFWRNGKPEEAAEIMRRRIESSRGQFPVSDADAERMINAARNGKDEFAPGWPVLAIFVPNAPHEPRGGKTQE